MQRQLNPAAHLHHYIAIRNRRLLPTTHFHVTGRPIPNRREPCLRHQKKQIRRAQKPASPGPTKARPSLNRKPPSNAIRQPNAATLLEHANQYLSPMVGNQRASSTTPAKKPPSEATNVFSETMATSPCVANTFSALGFPVVAVWHLFRQANFFFNRAYRDCKQAWVSAPERRKMLASWSDLLTVESRPRSAGRRAVGSGSRVTNDDGNNSTKYLRVYDICTIYKRLYELKGCLRCAVIVVALVRRSLRRHNPRALA